MADWDDMIRNANRYGTFAGRSEIEQDAYFEFFAGSDHKITEDMRLALVKVLRQAAELSKWCSLRWTQFRLAFLRRMERS